MQYPILLVVLCAVSLFVGVATSTAARTANFWPLGRLEWNRNFPSSNSTLADDGSLTTISLPSTTIITITPTMPLQPTMPRSPFIRVLKHLTRGPRIFLPKRVPPFVRRPSSQMAPATTTTQEEGKTDMVETMWQQLGQVIFDKAAWEGQTGREFMEHANLVQAVTQAGFEAVQTDETNPWVQWKLHADIPHKESSSSDATSSANGGGDYDNSIRVWKGSSVVEGHGSEAPWILTQAVIPMSPLALVELMMDSNRVKTYNSWSTGREDLWEAPSVSSNNKDDGDHRRRTKIVRNRTQPPLGQPLISTTLLHAQPISDDTNSNEEGWVLVSRAIGGSHFATPPGTGTSEMLLGVNLCQSIPGQPDATLLTALTHVYSAKMPLMLAERLGLKSAVQFVQDIRAL